MPGPGGGSHGGGSRGGGSRGGGSRGGGSSHGGGFHGGHHHGGFHRSYYGQRTGCLGNFSLLLLMPIAILFSMGLALVNYVGPAFTHLVNGGEIQYNEAAFQAYADAQYAAEFGSSAAYEDNILIVFLANESADDYCVIAWVGDNINRDITDMFGNEFTAFGRTVWDLFSGSYYAYSLDSNLAVVIDTMTDAVVQLDLNSSFYTETSHAGAPASHVTNYTELPVTEKTVNRSLKNFTEETGIPAVIVIDNMETVFSKSVSVSDIMVLVVTGGIVAIAAYLIVRGIRGRKENPDQTN